MLRERVYLTNRCVCILRGRVNYDYTAMRTILNNDYDEDGDDDDDDTRFKV